MKQKNMVLMAVAVGCGLVAAFLTSRLGAGNNAPEMVEVIVAKKELKIGTVLEEREFSDVLTKAPFMRASLPPDVINTFEELKGRRLSRTLRAGNYFAPSDVNGHEGIPLPTGTFMYAVRMDAVRAAAGFVMPGAKVEVLSLQRHPTNTNLVRSRLILSDMLVVAVDINDRRPEGGGPAIPTISSVSLAVTPDQGKLLHNCESTGGELRLMLRGPQSNYASAAPIKVDDWYDFSDLFGDKRNNDGGKGPELVQIAFAKQDIALNTKITGENLGDFFELRSFVAPAPANAIKDLSDLKGKFIRIPLTADLPVLSNALADSELAPTPPEIREKRVVEKEIVEKERVVVKPAPRPNTFKHDLIIQNGPRHDVYTYEGKTKESMKLNSGQGDLPGQNLPNPEDDPSYGKPQAKPEGPKAESPKTEDAKPETPKSEQGKPAKPAKPEDTKPSKPDAQVTRA